MTEINTPTEPRSNVLDRVIAYFAPRVAMRRAQARLFLRHYEAASSGRRTQGWNRSKSDANAVQGAALSKVREAARDLVRNNGNAESALGTIADHTVGTGIVAKVKGKADAIWKAWAETTDCDSDGRADFYGIQELVIRTVAESGECLIRRRTRDPKDGFALPVQLQVLEPDYLDTLKTNITLPNGNKVIQGVEFDRIGRRKAYWLFKDHPGSELATSAQSFAVPAESVLHVYRQLRPGQVRGMSWFAPVLLRFKDYDEYSDATLMKQKIAACLAVFVTDMDGSAAPMGTANDDTNPSWDLLEPGLIENVPPGRQIQVVQPPSVREHSDYSAATLREIATGLGVTYEDLTGDYTDLPFSAARMSRLRHWARIERWRWRTLIPQLCMPVFRWAMEAAQLTNKLSGVVDENGRYTGALPEWTAPPLPMVDPANEGLAYMRNIRTGIMSLSEALRERGYDPKQMLEELAQDLELLDKLGLVLDCDARRVSQAGQAQASTPGAAPEPDTTSEPAPEKSGAAAKPGQQDDEDEDSAAA